MARRLVRCIHTQPGECENISRRAVIGGAATVVPAVAPASVLTIVDNTDATAEGRVILEADNFVGLLSHHSEAIGRHPMENEATKPYLFCGLGYCED